jgi:membrane protease YdiL (CAAX protease family)
LSKLPLVIARDLLGTDIPWITQGWIGIVILFFAFTFVLPALMPLRGFYAVMGIILLVTTVLDPRILQSGVWQKLFAGTHPMVTMFGERALIAGETLIVLAALFLIGSTRREAFLTTGDLNAPVEGLRLPGRKKPVTWIAFGAIMALLLGGLFFAFLSGQSPSALPGFATALPWLPLILLSAAMNAFGEEAMYRAAPLATVLPAIGPKHALWVTAIWFGLGHYYGGIPSGPVGFVQSGLLGLLLGKAMLDTRGMGWPWIIHVVLDVVIYTTLAMSYVS